MNKKSFSYAEAMVTMLIVAIIMVATTPILSQRKNVDQKQLWRLVEGKSSIYFGTGTEQRVLIGTNSQKANEDARLVIVDAAGAGEVNSKPIMRFYDATYTTELGRLISNASSVGLGANVLNAAVVNNSVAIGAEALSKATGNNNTAIGFNACANVTSGTNNICIGANSGPSAGNGESNNKLYIGPQTDNHSLIEGDFSGGRVDIFGQLWIRNGESQSNVLTLIENAASDITPSDARLKNIGKVSTAGLAEINKIVVKNFTYKNDKNKNPHVGVIAQELQKVFPHSVKKGEDGYLKIKTDEMFYAMLNAIKELDAKFNKNDAKVQKMEQEIENLRKENAILTQKITEIEQTLQKK